MVFSPPPDYLYQTVHPITGVVTTYSQMVGSDLSFARASASYSVFNGDGGINPFGNGAAPLKIRTFKFDYIHVYVAGETFTQQRDKLMQACMHGLSMTFVVKCGDGSLRYGQGVCNVSDMKESRDAMVLFTASIAFECVNPYLVDQYETGVLPWDNGLTWDVGFAVYSLAASAKLTAGTFQFHQGANTTPVIASNAVANDIDFALRTATPSPIPFSVFTGALEKAPLAQTTPLPVVLSALAPGVTTALTLTQSGITGGTLALALVQAGSAAALTTWDLSPNLFTLTGRDTQHIIVATGNVSDRDLIITVYGPIGAGYYFFNTSLPGGLFGVMGFQMMEGLNAGEAHQFDMGRQSVRKIVGANTYSSWQYFALPPGQMDWMRIDPGVNILQVSQIGTVSTTAQCKVSTKAHYL